MLLGFVSLAALSFPHSATHHPRVVSVLSGPAFSLSLSGIARALLSLSLPSFLSYRFPTAPASVPFLDSAILSAIVCLLVRVTYRARIDKHTVSRFSHLLRCWPSLAIAAAPNTGFVSQSQLALLFTDTNLSRHHILSPRLAEANPSLPFTTFSSEP